MEKNNEINPANTGGAKNKVVQTYAEDMAKVIEDDKSGLVKKIIHEEEAHEIEKENISPESMKNKFLMIVGLFLLVLGFCTLFYFIFTREIPTISVEEQFTPIIYNDKSTFLNVTDLKKAEIVQSVWNKVVETKVKSGGVEGIYLTQNKKIVGLRRFVALVGATFVPGSNQQFVGDNFMMGAVNTGADPARSKGKFFILMRVRSISDIFVPMRAWEKKMFSDLHGFFGFDIAPATNYLLTKDFEDAIVENKNARILYGYGSEEEKEIVMMYIFAGDNSLIIANDLDAAREIMGRLAASRIKE